MARSIKIGIKTIGQIGKAGSARLLNSFLQSGCAACDRATPQPLCVDCDRQLKAQIQRPLRTAATPQSPQIAALGAYDGVLKRTILALKYENKPDVALFLGTELGQRWTEADRRPACVLPIPLHASRQRQRGYNQAALLARSFCRASGLKLVENGLVRSQSTIPQHQLGLEARQQNLAGVFEIGKSLNRLKAKRDSINVVLVDDIYTTGTTMQSAIGVLADAGISTIGLAVAART